MWLPGGSPEVPRYFLPTGLLGGVDVTRYLNYAQNASMSGLLFHLGMNVETPLLPAIPGLVGRSSLASPVSQPFHQDLFDWKLIAVNVPY